MQNLACNGLTVAINGNNNHFKVGLLTLLADTLAAHALGGFKESMSLAHRICRSCMATTAQIQSCFLESEYELRTPLNHHIQLQSLTPSHSVNSTEYGINRRSILDDIPHFSVVGNLSHDIMHDIFEGLVQCELKLLLAYLVSVKHFTIDVLNDRLRRFDFGYSELSDKPSELDEKVIKSADQKIRQSAAKMWSLAVFLPLLVGDLVPEKCEAWDLFILLLKICSLN